MKIKLSFFLTIALFFINQTLYAIDKYNEPIFITHQVIIKGLKIINKEKELKTYVIPIKRAQNLILIEASVDSTIGNFVFDTGAPCLILNQTYFRNYVNYGSSVSGGVNGGASSFKTFVKSFEFSQLNYKKLDADVVDLSAIENSKKVKILGLLGTQLFSNYAVVIDPYQNQMYIHEVDKKGNFNDEQNRFRNLYLKTNFSLNNNVILLNAKVRGKNLIFAFDTGAEVNLIDFRMPKKVASALYPINRINMVGVGEENTELLYAKLDSLEIETRTFMNNRFLIADLKKMNKYYDQYIDGILGYDFYSRGIFMLNFVKKEFVMYVKYVEN
jgi:hypothetical protein